MNMYQSMHGVSKVQLSEVRSLDGETSVRHLIITDADGNAVEVRMFSEDAEALKVQLTGSLPIKV